MITNTILWDRKKGCSLLDTPAVAAQLNIHPGQLAMHHWRHWIGELGNGTPLRSTQSFRHRARPSQVTDLRNFALEDVNQERRRSTPTVSRRCSLQKTKIESPRTDVWPEPKQMSEIEERFLKLPDSQDYTRVRQFKIDSKGAVVSRGDSFRRKRHAQSSGTPKHDCFNTSPFPVIDSDGSFPPRPSNADSRSGSVSSEGSTANGRGGVRKMSKSTSSSQQHKHSTPTDTSSMGEGALRSSHPLHTQLQDLCVRTNRLWKVLFDDFEENTSSTMVSINIGGHECDLTFFEADPQTDYTWKDEKVQAYLLVYSIDRKSSFRTVVSALEVIRKQDKYVPIILAGNKIDLERRRAVSNHEVKCVAVTYDIAHFEISVALNHDVDDLLVGIVAEIKESFAAENDRLEDNISAQPQPEAAQADDFRAAIRRFSQRKKRQMGSTVIGGLELETGKCTNLNPVGLFEKFRQWRRGMSKC
uniref:Uncharacterized protein n=1 Tax=Ditylenchus dipsaci TaxID=166011 RepID=A0A915DKH8_9BILA